MTDNPQGGAEGDALRAALFPFGVVLLVARELQLDGRQYPEELVAVERAVPKRRREFLCGRVLARRALVSLGGSEGPIPQAPDRAPVWPEGYVGSIAHAGDLFAVAVARTSTVTGIGVDVEPARALPPDLLASICTRNERDWCEDAAQPEPADWARVIFSVKECVHKCVHPLSGVMLDFLDVEVHPGRQPSVLRIRAPLGWPPPLPPQEPLTGRYVLRDDHVFTSVTWSP